MKYQQKTFMVPVADKVDVGCLACVFGERFHEHDPKCSKARTCGVCDREHPKEWDHYLAPCQAPSCTRAEDSPKKGFCSEHAAGPQLAPDQSLEEFCNAYQRCNQ